MNGNPLEDFGSVEHQLAEMYRDRELLEEVLGVSEPVLVIEMIASMTDQLNALYAKSEKREQAAAMKPTPVKVHMYRDVESKTNWVFLKRV